MAFFDELRHLPVEKCHEQGSDMGTVHIGVRHDDDLVVAQFFQIEIRLFHSCTQGGDDESDFLAFEDLVKAGFFDIEDFPFKRKYGLKTAVPRLLGGTSGRIPLDKVNFAVGRVPLLAVRQFSGK